MYIKRMIQKSAHFESERLSSTFNMVSKADKTCVLKGTDLVHADSGLSGPEIGPSISVSSSGFILLILVA